MLFGEKFECASRSRQVSAYYSVFIFRLLGIDIHQTIVALKPPIAVCFVARRREVPISRPGDINTCVSKTLDEGLGFQVLTLKGYGRGHLQHSII